MRSVQTLRALCWATMTGAALIAGAASQAAEVRRDPIIDADADAALRKLYAENPDAAALSERAAALLVFPRVGRIGFGLGAESGYGVLRVGGAVDGYYKTFSISVGAQGGFQTYGYVILFMTEEALEAFRASDGYELGANGSIAVATAGATADTEPSRMKADTLGYIFDETGLMVSATIKAATITRVEE